MPPCHVRSTNKDTLYQAGPPTSGHINKLDMGWRNASCSISQCSIVQIVVIFFSKAFLTSERGHTSTGLACPLCSHARRDDDQLLLCTGLDEYLTDDIVSRYWEAQHQMVRKQSTGFGKLKLKSNKFNPSTHTIENPNYVHWVNHLRVLCGVVIYVWGIKGPSKWLVLPFSNLDKKNIAERKIFLENYLKELCNSPAISQSAELQEFLAYGGGERMSFVRRATDASVPRIDKMLVRGVKGAFDIFRTALPNSPLDEENAPRVSFEDTLPDQRFQEHLLDYSSREPEIKEHVRNFMENSSFKFTPDDLKGSESISRRVSLLRNTHLKITECCDCPVLNANSFQEEESPFGNTVIELIAVALQLDETTLGYLFSIFKILCAPCINRRHLDAFTRGRIIGKLEEGRSVTSVAAEFGIAHSIVSRL
ncbi:sorting nexin-19 [Trichonephila clavipes]|nr:sorting nexin-19 [Trichonephila clavipes]